MTLLDPVKQSAAERLSADFAEVLSRLDALERTRPRVSFGTGAPTDTGGLPGTLYVDTAGPRVYVLAPGPKWMAVDVQRSSAEALGFVTTTAAFGSPVALSGGPSVTITVPTNGFVMVFASVTLAADAGGGSANTSSAAVWLHEPTDIPNPGAGDPIIGTDISTVAFQDKMTAPNTVPSTGSGTAGGPAPYGDFLIFQATPGVRTYSLRYSRGGISAGTNSGSPQFKNRRLLAVAV